jgi:subtilisin family serine protease
MVGAVFASWLAIAGDPLPPGDTAPFWVFFDDKGIPTHEQDAALAQRAAELPQRTLARRQRSRSGLGVDVRDLPIAPAQLAAIARTGARVRTQSRWLNAVSVEADTRTREQLAALPGVRAVVPVARGHRELPIVSPAPVLPGPAPEGVALEQLAQLGIPELSTCGLTGDGVLVGVLDTGFQLDHVAFAELDVVATHDFIDDDDEVGFEDGDPEGQYFHGTWVLSLLAGRDDGNYRGAAPGISVLLAKTEDYSQEVPIEEDYFVEGLEWIEGMGADMATASLGYIDWYTPAQMDGATAVTSLAATVALDNGLILFNAMGNSGPAPTTLIAPADTDGVISVGAVDWDGVVTEFSSRGPTADLRTKPDVCGGGSQVWVVDLATTDGYGQGSGTSFATPLVAGLGALLLEAYPGTTPGELLELLHSTGSQALAPDNDYGWGIAGGVAAAAAYCDCLGVEQCDSGLDEDCDGLVDFEDPDCGAGTSNESDSTSSGSSSGTSDTGTSESGSSSSSDTASPSSEASSNDASSTTAPAPTSSSGLDDDSSSDATSLGANADGDSGCGCATGPGGAAPLLLVLLAGRPRSRRRGAGRIALPSR